MTTPAFKTPINEKVLKFFDGVPYYLTDLADATKHAGLVSRLVQVCNEPRLYNRMFAERFMGRVYQEQDAWSFLNGAAKGWTENSGFKFVLFNEQGEICAAVELKTGDTDNCEIGYWASEFHRGVASNMVIKLCELAAKAGFKQLYAMIAPDNYASQKVVTNAGFTKGEPRPYLDRGIYEYYYRKLN